jgi:hypothetical protein
LDDAGVPDYLEDVNLAGHSFDIGHIDDLRLDQDLNGYFLACEGMGGQFDFAESAFAYGLAQHVIADGIRQCFVRLLYHLDYKYKLAVR